MLFFYSRCPRTQPLVKVGEHVPPCLWSRRHCSTRRTCRVVSRRDVTSRVEFGLYFINWRLMDFFERFSIFCAQISPATLALYAGYSGNKYAAWANIKRYIYLSYQRPKPYAKSCDRVRPLKRYGVLREINPLAPQWSGLCFRRIFSLRRHSLGYIIIQYYRLQV